MTLLLSAKAFAAGMQIIGVTAIMMALIKMLIAIMMAASAMALDHTHVKNELVCHTISFMGRIRLAGLHSGRHGQCACTMSQSFTQAAQDKISFSEVSPCSSLLDNRACAEEA